MIRSLARILTAGSAALILALAGASFDLSAQTPERTRAAPTFHERMEQRIRRVLELNPVPFYLEHGDDLRLTTSQRDRLSRLADRAGGSGEEIIRDALARGEGVDRSALRTHRDAMRELVMWRREYALAARALLDEEQRERAVELRRRRPVR